MKMEPAESFVAEEPVIDLSNSSLLGLGYALRHAETWPKSFRKWYYGDCSTCAMGLACALWSLGLHDPHNMMRAFGISVCEYLRIFCSDAHSRCDVTPEMVADEIDAIVASRVA